MIDIETLTRLKTMRLSGMAEYFENLADTTTAASLNGPELVKQAVDWEYERRRDNKLHRLRRQAALAQPDADIGDIKATNVPFFTQQCPFFKRGFLCILEVDSGALRAQCFWNIGIVTL